MFGVHCACAETALGEKNGNGSRAASVAMASYTSQ
jgi:hypothetical protein